MPGASRANIDLFYEAIDNAMEEFDINTEARVAGFLAQIAHESGNLRAIRENLNYKAESLTKVWPKYFPNIAIANQYAKQPEKIANRAYANRMGNGPESSGEGWAYRGRGLIQLTGKQNYTNCGRALGYDLLNDPSYLETPEGAARSAAWFWASHGLNEIADRHDITLMTKRINGGTLGLAERKENFEHALSILAG